MYKENRPFLHLISVHLHGMILLRKREQQRHRIRIPLVFRIQAVGLLMPQLQALGGVVHDICDQNEGNQHHDPLFSLHSSDSGDGHAEPEQDL